MNLPPEQRIQICSHVTCGKQLCGPPQGLEWHQQVSHSSVPRKETLTFFNIRSTRSRRSTRLQHPRCSTPSKLFVLASRKASNFHKKSHARSSWGDPGDPSLASRKTSCSSRIFWIKRVTLQREFDRLIWLATALAKTWSPAQNPTPLRPPDQWTALGLQQKPHAQSTPSSISAWKYQLCTVLFESHKELHVWQSASFTCRRNFTNLDTNLDITLLDQVERGKVARLVATAATK